MKTILRFCLAIFFTCACMTASATPQRFNGTELWLNPAESGWGLYIDHQGDTLFATLFVYGSDGKPLWYSASSLVGDGTYSGALFESTGTPWGMPFDQSTVSRRQVGTMQVELRGDNATLTYDVDGTRVTKEIIPFAFSFVTLQGSYYGHMAQPASAPGGAVDEEVSISINHTSSSFTMYTQATFGPSCTYTGTPSQKGSLVSVNGSYTCGDGRSGPFTMFDADLTSDGFTARIVGGRIADTHYGRITGVRLSASNWGWNGWMSDLWIAPGESGWGLNMVGQGQNNIFGTLFVYDENRRAKWYSISDLHYIGGMGGDNRGTYVGNIIESTGPWFGLASFDSATVVRHIAGGITVKFLDNRHADVTFNFGFGDIVKSMVPFAMRMNDLSGTYGGEIVQLMSGGATAAASMKLTVTDNGNNVVMTAGFFNSTCTYTGIRTQYGQRVGISGTWTCNGDGSSGSFTMSDLEVTNNGFTGAMTGMPGGLANPVGHIGGARTGEF